MQAPCKSDHVQQVGSQQPDYQQRRPEQSTLYQVVAQYMQTLFAEAEQQNGHGYPVHVKREFERYLRCGQFCCGFARVRCASCGFERLLPYSCKGRSICPSCVGRRMADTASHLADHVLPVAPYRLWTLSLPRSIRLPVVRDPSLLTKVLVVFLRTVFAYQRRRARKMGITEPQTGSVSFIQLFGSILQLTPHAHSWIPDGVFAHSGDGTLRFHPLPPPTDDDVESLLARIARRVSALIVDDESDAGDDGDMQLWAQAEASQAPLFSIPFDADERKRKRCAFVDGFSLHADVSVDADRREKLERLLRYGLRPPFAARRLSWTADGKVRLELRKPWHTGQRDIIFEPVAFLRRLAAAIPKPRQNMVRFHGVFAPNAKLRSAVKTLLPAPPKQQPLLPQPDQDVAPLGAAPDDSTELPIRYRRPWAELLARIFGHQVLVCPHCQGRMNRVQLVEDPAVIRRVLTHLGLPTALPPVAPARDPPQVELDFDDSDFDM